VAKSCDTLQQPGEKTLKLKRLLRLCWMSIVTIVAQKGTWLFHPSSGLLGPSTAALHLAVVEARQGAILLLCLQLACHASVPNTTDECCWRW
jgi:hypothetical protein